MVPWSAEWKHAQLSALYEQWRNCQECPLHEVRNNVVFGEGHPDADILLVGEGPGETEDSSGVPFHEDGRSGDLLRSMIANVGLDWNNLYVSNVIGCRPPDNRDPVKVEKEACLPRLHEIIYLVDPLLIVAIGKYALNALVGGRSWGIESEQGKLFSSPNPAYRISGERNGAEIAGRVFPLRGGDKNIHRLEYEVVPILHPAYILRVDSFDQKTETFAPGGLFYQSMGALEAVVSRIEQLKAKHADVSRLLERM